MVQAETRIRVMTVDDHPLIREGVAAVIGCQKDMVLVAEGSNGSEAIERFRLHRPDITRMDLQLPKLDGVEAITAIRCAFPPCPNYDPKRNVGHDPDRGCRV